EITLGWLEMTVCTQLVPERGQPTTNSFGYGASSGSGAARVTLRRTTAAALHAARHCRSERERARGATWSPTTGRTPLGRGGTLIAMAQRGLSTRSTAQTLAVGDALASRGASTFRPRGTGGGAASPARSAAHGIASEPAGLRDHRRAEGGDDV